MQRARLPMNPHLFVYGTLLSRAGHRMGERLRRDARLIGDASIQGRLYSLGRYPGLVETEVTSQRVYGELYRLEDPASALAWLDAYEGIAPQRGAHNEYERVERPVRLGSDQSVTAWVYLYRASVQGRAALPDGRWRIEG
jgi:gamma-glutamylcyclotransferase (GGCT)/AIG2-like uncharacterized protein YtfP